MKTMTQLKLFIVGLLILCPNILLAKHVSEETARKVAVNHMNINMQAKALRRQKESARARVEQRAFRKMTKERIGETFSTTKDGIVVYYVFNFSPEGWAIISADDVAYPVIGYSDTGYYDPNISNQPAAFIDWMDNAASQIADAASQNLKARPKEVSDWQQLSIEPNNFQADLGELAKAEEAGPLIRTKWGQASQWVVAYCFGIPNNSYNKYCPWEYTGWTHACKDYCPTGCVATAMAQIMKYWQWPPFGRGSHKYDTKYSCSHQCDGFKGREVNFRNRYYNWSDSSMPLKKSSDAIALLMYDIGVAVEMGYTPSGSGAFPWDAADAFRKYFRYEGGDYKERKDFSKEEWIDKLVADLDNGRPILYCGDPKNSAKPGHAFICDGYKFILSSRFFHFNWGWDGLFDGYFLSLDFLIPLPWFADYSYNQNAILSLEPEQWGTVSMIYVDDDYTSDGYNDGHTWNVDAFNKINDAIVGASYESNIYVAAGTYYESIDLKGKAIHLYAVSGPTSTIINGVGTGHVVKCIRGEDASTVIEGFTITGGNANGSYPNDRGGGMYNDGSSPTVTNCMFINNSANAGGGMCNNESNPTVTNCIFSGNSAEWGAGMWNYGSSPTVINSTFTNNTSTRICSMYNEAGSNPVATNCIFWSSTASEIYNYNSSSITVTYSDVKGGYSGTGNIDADPCFVEAGFWDVNGVWIEGDYHLLENSPCIDAGNPNYSAGPNETDLDGNPRIYGDRIDMGAYEFTILNTAPLACIVGGDRVVEAGEDCAGRVVLDGSCSSDADSTAGTNDDINDFDWYEVIDACEPNSYIFIGSGEVIECNLGLGEHLIILKVTDKAGPFDGNEVVITVEDETSPVITLNGADAVVLECGVDNYVEEGATAHDNCDDDVPVIIGGDTVDTSICGTYIVTYDATDDSGNATVQATRMVTVNDTTGPVIALNGLETVILECGTGSYVEEGATATDSCDDDVAVIIGGDVVDTSGCGTYVVTYDATDSWGNEAEQVLRMVIVEDTLPPEFSLFVEPSVLWPPNHRMVRIEVSWEVSDDCDEEVEVSLVGITSSEQDDGRGDGRTKNDIIIGDDGSIYLRAERTGSSAGRVYTITYEAVDDSGNATVGSAEVLVPDGYRWRHRRVKRLR